MRARLALPLLLSMACGALGEPPDEAPPGDDGGTGSETGNAGDDGGRDATPEAKDALGDSPGTRCTVDEPFGSPTVVAELTGATSARVYAASVVAAIPQGAESDVVEGAAGAQLTTFTGIITGATVDTIPAPCAGGLCLFWEHADSTGAKTEIWSATRMSIGGALNGSAPVTLPIPSVVRTHDPWVIADGDVFYFTYEQGTTIDVWRASKTGSTYDAVPVGGIASGLPETSAVLTDDESTIFFARTVAAGDDDVYVASRPDPSQPFSGTIRVDAASVTGKNDRPTWVSADGCVLWITSNRDGATKVHRLSKR